MLKTMARPAAAGLLAQLLLSTTISAQDRIDLEQSYRESRADMLGDLADPGKALRFVDAAVAVGDVRGAIAALERLLLIDPTLTNIKLELGLLYQRAGAQQVARDYLDEVRTARETPPEMRARAEAALGEADERLSRHLIIGSLALETRYDTNANAAPESVNVFGFPAEIVSPDDMAAEDVSFAAGLDLEHIYDFGDQRGTRLETGLSLFGTQQVNVETANIGFAAIDTGPAFRIGRSGNARLRPYVGVSGLSLERAYYLTTGLVGLEGGTVLDPQTFISGKGELLLNDYVDSDENPNASDRSGPEMFAQLALTREVIPAVSVSGQLSGGFVSADEEFESYQSLGLGIAASYAVDNPLDPSLDPLGLHAAAQYSRFDYDQPDPFVDPDKTQVDNRFEFRLGASLPFRPKFAATMDFYYITNDSTLPNDTFDDFRVSVGVRYDFSVIP